MQITQCPECHTAFKVSPVHLAVANGWVRCGRCGGVFEALQHLEPDLDPPMGEAQPTSVASEAATEQANSLATHAAAGESATGRTLPDASSNDIDAFHDSLMSFVPGAITPSATATETPHFSKSTQQTNNTSQPNGWLWGVLSGVLSLCLLLQVVLWNRHMLVAQEPAMQGLVEGLCVPFGCEWHWPQSLEAVQIENSNFTENADGTYRLQLRLKNTQHHAVAMPLLELTLTDERDEVVLRRVFQPEALGLKDHLPALRDARSTLHFDLNEDLKPRVVGFRALIFYP